MSNEKTQSEAAKSPQEMLVIGSSCTVGDFRIGNYLRSKEWGGIGQLEGIEVLDNRIDFKTKGYVHSLEEGQYFDLEPILLTKEWILRFGFKEYGNAYSIDAWSPGHPSQRFDIDWREDKGITCKSRYQADSDYFLMRHVKHVHQLQNLYYALSGDELKLDL